MVEWADLHCPYCGEGFETAVDVSAGSHDTIEDCPVCCHPIELHVEIDGNGDLSGIEARRDDE
jgi:hypothetical protein